MPPKTRVAMESILSDVHPEDYFGIILFDRSIDLWKESLTKATEENVDEAIKFVRQIYPRGSRLASTWLDIKLILPNN